MATVIRRRAQVASVSSAPLSVSARTVNNLTRVDASTADWHALNNQIESNSEKISNLEQRTDSLEATISSIPDVIEKVDQISYLLDVDLLTFDEIGA